MQTSHEQASNRDSVTLCLCDELCVLFTNLKVHNWFSYERVWFPDPDKKEILKQVNVLKWKSVAYNVEKEFASVLLLG
jgi:hypothetical protein